MRRQNQYTSKQSSSEQTKDYQFISQRKRDTMILLWWGKRDTQEEIHTARNLIQCLQFSIAYSFTARSVARCSMYCMPKKANQRTYRNSQHNGSATGSIGTRVTAVKLKGSDILLQIIVVGVNDA